MGIPNAQRLQNFGEGVHRIALELTLAEAGKDNGLLPVNSLISDLEEACGGLPAPCAEAWRLARGWVDEALDAGGFTEDLLLKLRAWAEWAESAVFALQAGQLPPAFQPPASVPAKASAAAAGAEARRADEATEPLVLNLEGDGDLLREFTGESHEHLQNIELGVLTLEENPTDVSTLNSIFRAFHTFKGSSGFLNLRPINNLAHELESLLDLARQQKLAIDSDVINVILAGGDTLKRFVAEIESQLDGARAGEPILISTSELLARVRAILRGAASEAPAPEGNISPTEAASPAAPAVRVEAATQSPGAATPSPATPSAPTAGAKIVPMPAAEPASRAAARSSARAAAVKVDTHKLDSLVDLVGEMVIAQSMVMQDTELTKLQSQQLSRNLAQLGRITKELQRVAMSLRMVPIRSTFQKMTRLVRDLSMKAGKQVELQMSGEDTELDRTIVEEISDPLVHMIRNAVDHGIEPADRRLAAGKSPHGNIRLRAFHQGGNIVIEVEDDGGGLSRERILRKAIERGLVAEGAQLSDSAILNLIFAPGFSTAEKVTDISGRGVGMDVVRRNIEKLRGKVEIQSTPGKGSRFTIYLPLTLAIIDGMIVGIGGQRYILPTLAVRESFRPAAGMVSTVQGRAEVVNVRGRLMPLVRLHALFGTPSRATRPEDGIIIVVESDHGARCVLVDDLLGKQEVVIKSLGQTFKKSAAVAGAAILGDGRVGLILDVDGIMGMQPPVYAAAA